MALTWNPRFSTGLDWQDAQHQELFKRINALLDSTSSGNSPQVITEILTFLADYAIFHFTAEEQVMEAELLSSYAAHKAAHEEFIHDFQALKEEFLQSGASVTMRLKLQNFLTSWLMAHIGGMDIEMGKAIIAASRKRSA
jgi:hemerythrin